jgi:hypothetical protein
VVTKTLDELSARQAWPIAERDGAPEVSFASELSERASDPVTEHLLGTNASWRPLGSTASSW